MSTDSVALVKFWSTSLNFFKRHIFLLHLLFFSFLSYCFVQFLEMIKVLLNDDITSDFLAHPLEQISRKGNEWCYWESYSLILPTVLLHIPPNKYVVSSTSFALHFCNSMHRMGLGQGPAAVNTASACCISVQCCVIACVSCSCNVFSAVMY